jgi:TatD DNase family protein
MDHVKHIDAHAHLNFDQYEDDREDVIAEMKAQEIAAINIGIDADTSRESIDLAQKHNHITASVGCHPTEASSEFTADPYRKMVQESSEVVALGECGLDYSRSQYRTKDQKKLQERVFTEQIKLAAETGLPLILHIRPQDGSMDAYEDGLDILRHYQNTADTNLAGTAHFFVGNKDIAGQFLDLGFHISFTGPLTYDSHLQDVCAYIPKNRLLAETDSPFAPPQSASNSRNIPLELPKIVQAIAETKEGSLERISHQLKTNAARLFSPAYVERENNL